MMNTVTGESAGERSAAAERRQALVQDARVAELVEADRGRVGARGASAVDHGFAPGGDLREIIARMIAGAWLLGVSWKACEPISMPM